jgi:hypothetical protein
VGADEATLTLVLKARNLAGREVDKLGGSLGGVGAKAKSAGGHVAHFGKLAAIAAGVGVVALAGAIIGLTQAAADEEKGIARMTAALKASDKGFSGNTDAIEKVIAKREELAFSDDDLRSSLTTLVTKYKDTDKALAVQATAMDLARLKGISLDDATAMLTKGMDGNAKVLKQLGIELPKTATEQDRLAAIQKAAAGQAEAYGKTAAGAQEAFGIALADLGEDVGSAFLPAMAAIFTTLREQVIPAVRRIAAAIGKWLDENRPLIEQLKAFAGTVLKNVVAAISTVVGWLVRVFQTITGNKDVMNVLRAGFALIASAVGLVWAALEKVLGFLGDVFATITGNKAIVKGFQTAWKLVGDAIKAVVDSLAWIIGNAGKAIDAIAGIPGVKLVSDAAGAVVNAIPHAEGGWAGLKGPELSLLGERGPEYVLSQPMLRNLAQGQGATPGYVAVAVSERDLARMVDERLYYTIQRAAPARSRA